MSNHNTSFAAAVACDTVSPRGELSAWPLVQLGPGGDYVRRYVGVGTRIVREGVASERCGSGGSISEITRPLSDGSGVLAKNQGVLATVRATFARLLARLDHFAMEVFTVPSDESEANIHCNVASQTASSPNSVPQSAALRRPPVPHEFSHSITPEIADESHPEANEGTPYCSRHPQEDGLLADHAGDRRRAPRQQSHGVRARRSTHREGSASARCEQGSLFDAVA